MKRENKIMLLSLQRRICIPCFKMSENQTVSLQLDVFADTSIPI
ncbi:MAG: hypothetical protein N2235_08290 [Fischerella sp.]|nr:hypothetical protein [Fischerella sp.]